MCVCLQDEFDEDGTPARDFIGSRDNEIAGSQWVRNFPGWSRAAGNVYGENHYLLTMRTS